MDDERNWQTFKRALLLLKQLQQGPHSRRELMTAVSAQLPDAYQTSNAKAAVRTFERDLQNLRERLQATIVWDHTLRAYVLQDAGPFGQNALPDAAMTGLAFLFEAFATNHEAKRMVTPLLDWFMQSVPPDQLRRLGQHTIPLELGVDRLSEKEIMPEVWRMVNHAIHQRRLFRFPYLSPVHENEGPRIHTVEPYEIQFRNGHYYLHAYCRRWEAPNGWTGGGHWATPYRLDYIQKDELTLLKTFSPRQQQPKLISIRYKLAPRIVRGGVTRYFTDMVVGEPDAEGWVTVSAKADSVFDAHRILLGYGELCIALDPPQLVERMATVSQKMATHYASLSPEDSPPS